MISQWPEPKTPLGYSVDTITDFCLSTNVDTCPRVSLAFVKSASSPYWRGYSIIIIAAEAEEVDSQCYLDNCSMHKFGVRGKNEHLETGDPNISLRKSYIFTFWIINLALKGKWHFWYYSTSVTLLCSSKNTMATSSSTFITSLLSEFK